MLEIQVCELSRQAASSLVKYGRRANPRPLQHACEIAPRMSLLIQSRSSPMAKRIAIYKQPVDQANFAGAGADVMMSDTRQV